MLAVVRSSGVPRRLETAQEYADFEQELVDQFLLAGLGAGISDGSIADDRRAIFEFVRFLGRPVWTAGPEDADRFLPDQRKAKREPPRVELPFDPGRFKRFGEYSTHELGIVPDAYEPHLDVGFTKLRDGFDEAV
ncbi:hypothetical protein [Streptomyces sp. NPDC048385]|uniref:hypothetical protein n=1 Tax=unclassified Streptomyces TaxID=2593676 RepID=UPI003420B50A